MICNATMDDIDWMAREGRDFYREAPFYSPMNSFNEGRARSLGKRLIKDPDGIIIVDRERRSYFLGHVAEHFFAPMRYAYDLVLWVPKEHRGAAIGYRLLKEYIRQATALGAHEIFAGEIAGIDQATLLGMYERLGMQPRTKQYSMHTGV